MSEQTVKNPLATILMEDGKKMTAELFPGKAPNTVNNFITLASQGGCPQGTGMGGPGYEIKGEFPSNGFAQNDLRHTAGVLSMARTGDPDSAGSQFFITVAPAEHLDGDYAVFGQVIEGMDDAIAISRVPRGMMNDRPKKPVVIQSIRVDTRGMEYPAPETR